MQVDLDRISKISSTLETTQVTSIKEEKLDTIISNLWSALNDLEMHVNDGFDPLTEILKPDIIEILSELDTTINACIFEESERVEELCEKILIIQTTVEIGSSDFKLEMYSDPIESLAFFCDVNVPDVNHVVATQFRDALKDSHVPLIISGSILNESPGLFQEIETFIVGENAKWEVYQKEGLFVFIPLSLLPEKDDQAKLEALDFVTNGSLKKIFMSKTFPLAKGKSELETFFALFRPDSKIDKAIYLIGIGSPECVAALEEEEYRKFLDFLEKQRCKGLSINSYYSEELEVPEQPPENFLDQEKEHTFLTTHSLDDYEASSLSLLDEIHLRKFLADIAKTESSHNQMPIAKRKKIEKLEEDRLKKLVGAIQSHGGHPHKMSGKLQPIAELKAYLRAQSAARKLFPNRKNQSPRKISP